MVVDSTYLLPSLGISVKGLEAEDIQHISKYGGKVEYCYPTPLLAEILAKAENVMEVYHNPMCNVMYRRRVLEEVGGFNHNLVTVDDEELDYRISRRGYRILYLLKAIVYHYRRRSWRSLASMAYNYG